MLSDSRVLTPATVLPSLPRAPGPDASVLFAVSVDRYSVLHEAVSAPAALRVVADLHDGVGALALLLRQRHDDRVVAALVHADTGRHVPVVVELACDIFLIDRNLHEGLVDPVGQPGPLLRPALRVIDMTEYGTLTGTVAMDLVTPASCANDLNLDLGNAVYIYNDLGVTPGDFDGIDVEPVATAAVTQNQLGDYVYETLLSPGDYTVAFTCQAMNDGPLTSEAIAFVGATDASIADGQTLTVSFAPPGAANSPSGSSWIWGPYYVDYIKENGEWKILHSNLTPLFRNPYQYSWGESPHHGTVNVSGMLGLEPDAPSTLYRPFNEVKAETDIFRNHPGLPQPY